METEVHEKSRRIFQSVAAFTVAAADVAAVLFTAAAAAPVVGVCSLLQVRDEPLDDAAVDHPLADGGPAAIIMQRCLYSH